MSASRASTSAESTRSATVRMPMLSPICAIASTMLRSMWSCVTLCMNCPSIFRKSTGRFFRKMNDDRPLPKSSSEKRQPRLRSSRMKCVAEARLVMAADSVSSKHSAPGVRSALPSSVITKSRNCSSLSVVEEMLIASTYGSQVVSPRRWARRGAGLAHDPAVDGRHQVEALGRRDELGRLHQLALLVAHAQQQLEVADRVDAGADRHDRLAHAARGGPRRRRG